ncbi:methyltransferase domain-containing protein [Pseudonocardia sp. NPDC049635]|uniref:methyltransferase domain-containing protein n=1 Tax=Pseudonocardia sp. NPDC049635 TaxID=3155506 RepID=UPI0033D3927A
MIPEPSIEELPGDRLRIRVDGREIVIDALCPHRLGRLVHGHLNPRALRLTCPLHRTTFDLTTGCPVAGPGTRRLTIHRTGVPGQEYRAEQVWLPASERLLEWGPEFHDLLLGDVLRVTAFRAAVLDTVRAGDTVLDLGTGTGILARWALEAGAATVYGIERDRQVLTDAARRLARAGFGPDRFVPVPGTSFDVELPRRVDVIVSEILGNLTDNENCVAILADARHRFLAPGGRMMPLHSDTHLVPVDAGNAHHQVGRSAPADAVSRSRFTEALTATGVLSPFDLYYDTIVPRSCQLSAPQVVRRHDLETARTAPEYSVALGYRATRAGTLTGFKGWFAAQLSPAVGLDISGDDIERRATSDSWKHCYLPITDPIPVRAGDLISVRFGRMALPGRDGTGQSYSWQGTVASRGRTVATFAQGTRLLHRVAGRR